MIALNSTTKDGEEVFATDGALHVKVVSGGGGGTTIDRELVVSTYSCKTAFTGASVGDTITATQVIDVTDVPTAVSTIWRNQTTAANLASAPSAANLELVGSAALTDAQLRASAVPVSGTVGVSGTVPVSGPLTDTQLRASAVPVSVSNFPATQAVSGTVTANTGLAQPVQATDFDYNTGALTNKTQRVTLATDGPLVTAAGQQADAAATTDTGTFSILAFIKRGMQNWTTLLARVPAQNISGLLPVDTLATPGVARVQATSGTAASIALTASCRRVSMYATTGTWYAISGTATSSSHYIAAGERLDFDVPASTTISVLQESAAGSIRITELT